jgi:hypothetical protein
MAYVLTVNRPDAVTKTGVVEPFFTRQISPIAIARTTIDPFIDSVRPRGMAIEEPATQIARAAAQVAEQHAQGQPATVQTPNGPVTVKPGAPATGPAAPVIAAAKALQAGQAVKITAGRTSATATPSAPAAQTLPGQITALAARTSGLPGAISRMVLSDAPSGLPAAYAPAAMRNAYEDAADPMQWAASVRAPALASIPGAARAQFLRAQQIANQRR